MTPDYDKFSNVGWRLCRRLRLDELIRRLPNTNRYVLTEDGTGRAFPAPRET